MTQEQTEQYEAVGDVLPTVLRAAAVRLSDNRWTQRAFARDAHNDPTQHLADEACKWCLTGALAVECYRAYPNAPSQTAHYDALRSLCDGQLRAVLQLRGSDDQALPHWNDHPHRTASEVRAALYEAATSWERGRLEVQVGK